MSNNKKEKKIVYRPDFKIFQYVKLTGIRQVKKEQSLTRFISPIFGSKVPDKTVIPVVEQDLGDVDKRFDAFRSRPKISKEEAKRKYGNEYYEFTNLVTHKTREEVLGGKIVDDFEDDYNYKEEEIIKPISPKFEEVEVEEKIEEQVKSASEKFKYKLFEDKVKAADISPVIDDTYEYNDEPKLETFSRIPEEEIINSKPVEKKIEVKKPKSNTYIFPSIDMFEKHKRDTEETPEWVTKQINIINDTLENFSIDGRVIGSKKGPTVTRYEISLSPGVNVNRINNISDNLQMGLQSRSLRIEAPIPGKPYVGLEVPNEVPEIVAFGNVIDDPKFLNSKDKPLLVALGEDIDGENVFVDIAKMPHGLIAGATNSGKSVCINTILVSLLLKNKPEDLRLLLIDPKMVELSAYNDLPHLLTPVITDVRLAATALEWVVDEMEKRYLLFSENRSRDIKSFNEGVKSGRILEEKMPYIVIVIDELADLMMVVANEVEDSIQRLTQKARAAGIHLLVATQRPTTDVVKGTIKSNIPARIAFKVASYVDSTTILDRSGAENLLGKGDMLLKEVDNPIRLQGAYITDDEIYRVTDFIRETTTPNYVIQHNDLKQKTNNKKIEKDELFEDVARFVVIENTASINRITQEFSISFNRAQAIVKSLEEYGIVSGHQGTKARDVLVNQYELSEILGDDL